MMSRDLGGIQQSFLDYSAALEEEGHEVVNVTSIFAKINKRLSKTIKLPNLSQWCIFSRIYLYILTFIHKPDIILTHGNRAIAFAYSAKLKSISLVGIAHNYKIKRLKKCNYIIAVTKSLSNYLVNKGFNRDKIFHVPNMLTLSSKKYQKGPYKKPLVIGGFGRFVAKKGFNYLIEAVALLKKKNHDVKLIIGGCGIEKKSLRLLTEKLDISGEVKFFGWVKDKDKFFAQIDIFCLPSVSEPFGIILLEAMQRFTPVVATRSDGPLEILRDKKDALLTKIGSSEDLAKNLSVLISDEEKARQLSQSAYKRLTECYDIKVVRRSLVNILSQIMD